MNADALHESVPSTALKATIYFEYQPPAYKVY